MTGSEAIRPPQPKEENSGGGNSPDTKIEPVKQANTDVEAKSDTKVEARRQVDAAKSEAKRIASLAKIVKQPTSQTEKLQTQAAELDLNIKLSNAASESEVGQALGEFKTKLGLAPEAEEVLSQMAQTEQLLAKGGIKPVEVPEAEVSKTIEGLKEGNVANEGTPELRANVTEALGAAKAVEEKLEAQPNSKAKLNIFEKVKNRVVTRWTRLSFRVKHFSRKILGVKKTQKEVYDEAVGAGFSANEAANMSRSYEQEAKAAEAEETETEAKIEAKTEATQPEPQTEAVLPEAAVKPEAVVTKPEIKQPEPLQAKAELKPDTENKTRILEAAEKQTNDKKAEIKDVLEPALPEDVDLDKLSLGELNQLWERANKILGDEKMRTFVTEIGEVREKRQQGIAVSARIEQANYDIMRDLAGDSLFDAGNMAEAGNSSVFATGKKIVSGEISEADLDTAMESISVRDMVQTKYTEYFKEQLWQDYLQGKDMPEGFVPTRGMERAKAEMESTVNMLEKRNSRMQKHMHTYFSTITGNDNQDLEQLGKSAVEKLAGMTDERERGMLEFNAENAVKTSLFADVLRAQLGEGAEAALNSEELKEIIKAAEIELTMAGPAIVLDQTRLKQFFNILKNKDITQGKSIYIRGALVKGTEFGDIIFADNHSTQHHEMGHLINTALREAKKEAAADFIGSWTLDRFINERRNRLSTTPIQTREYEVLETEIAELENNRAFFAGMASEIITGEKSKIEQEGELNPAMLDEFRTTINENKRLRLQREVYKNLTKVPLTEEVGASIINGSPLHELTLAQIGVNPEKMIKEGEPIAEEILVANLFIEGYNQIVGKIKEMQQDQNTSDADFAEYVENFASLKRMLGRAILEHGNMNMQEALQFMERLQSIHFKKLFKDKDGNYLFNNLSSLKQDKDGNPVYRGRAEEVMSYFSRLKEGTISVQEFNDFMLKEWIGGNAGDASQHLEEEGMVFSTGVTGGYYQELATGYLGSDDSPLHLKDRGKVDLWYSFFGGNKATIQEDSRGTAGLFFRGLWNWFDILGVTPYKMNEAYGAWAVKLLGKRTAGIFGFHDALGADPIGKGLPGALGRLKIFDKLREDLKIPAHAKEFTDRITSPRIIDINAQIIGSIEGKLREVGKDHSRILVILEALGGLKFEGQQHSLSLEAFLEPDETRFNPVLQQMTSNAKLANDGILGRNFWNPGPPPGAGDLLDDGHQPFLLKGQMSDGLLKDIKESIYIKNPGLRATFQNIGTSMMGEDINTWTAARAARAAEGKDPTSVHEHFTIKDLIERVNRVESNTKGPGQIVNPAYLGRGTWPNLEVQVGVDAAGDPQYFQIDDVKKFIVHFYKAKTKEVLETGVFGMAHDPATKFDLYDPATGAPSPRALALGITNEDVIKLNNGEFVTKFDGGVPPKITKIGMQLNPMTRTFEYFEHQYSKASKIEKMSMQTGMKIQFPSVEEATVPEILDLVGKFAIDPATGDMCLTEKGKIIDEIDGDIKNKKKALDFYFKFTQRTMQTQEFAEVAKLKKKLWGWLANLNRIARWTMFTGFIVSMVAAPHLLVLFKAEYVAAIFIWDWIASRFLSRSRDGWGARNGIAEETAGKLEGMRSIFEKGRTAQSLTGDEIRMMNVYMGSIDKMWEDLMPSYDKVVKYKKNITQNLSMDFLDLSKQVLQLP